MIDSKKINNALSALQGLIIHGRKMAYDGEDLVRIAALLDYAEYLPSLILSKEDETDRYREVLATAAERFQCGFILERFDEQ